MLLSHADRSRILDGSGPGAPYPQGGVLGTLLVDGFYRAFWTVLEASGAATLTVDRFTPLPRDGPGTVDEIIAEGARLLAFVAPDSGERQVRFAPGL